MRKQNFEDTMITIKYFMLLLTSFVLTIALSQILNRFWDFFALMLILISKF